MAVPEHTRSFLWPQPRAHTPWPRAHKPCCSGSLNWIPQLTENQVFLGFCFARIPRLHFSFPAPLWASINDAPRTLGIQ